MEQAALGWPTAGALALAVATALLWDVRFGEPPARLHPVVGMGWMLATLGRRVAPPPGAPVGPGRAFAAGALAWTIGAAGVVALAWALQALLGRAPWWAQGLALGVLLKPLLAWRMLRDEVAAVEAALSLGLQAARMQVARLVSRDVQGLDEAGVRQAALSTLAENLNDSVVAPLFWFALVGLPGAALYRWANTADAMWGYRGVRSGRDWTFAGRWAARADDALSWLPARLTAVLLLAASGRSVPWRALRAQARRTPSPNGGWPMGALALRLGVRLVKPGVYALNEAARLPQPVDTARALAWCDRAVAGWGALLVAGLAGVAMLGRPS